MGKAYPELAERGRARYHAAVSDIEAIVRAGVEKRVAAIRAMERDFRALQEEKLRSIVCNAAETEFGRAHGFDRIGSVADFQRAVRPSVKEDYEGAWKRMIAGERNVLFPEPLYACCLSSGTTTGEPKRVPLNKALVRGLKRAIGYATASYIDRMQSYSLLRGYALQMSAPAEVERTDGDVPVGYVTGIVSAARTYPFHNLGLPPLDVLNIPDWSEKYRIVEERFLDSDIRMVFGIPGYVVGLMRQILAHRRLDDIHAVWPNLELIATSGTAMELHEPAFARLAPRARMIEMYLCSETPVAFQPGTEPGMMPMVEDVFFEFVPEKDWGADDPARLTLAEVEPGVRYVVLVTTPAGLYAYSPGDTVVFSSNDPPRLRVAGRQGAVVSLSGEKVDEDQARRAVRETGLELEGFLVCPADPAAAPGHEWVLEFKGEAPPLRELESIAVRLDESLRRANASYATCREGGVVLDLPVLTPVVPGTFERALRRRRGQGKILPVYPDRRVRDELVAQ